MATQEELEAAERQAKIDILKKGAPSPRAEGGKALMNLLVGLVLCTGMASGLAVLLGLLGALVVRSYLWGVSR